jgi:hypothetical protein
MSKRGTTNTGRHKALPTSVGETLSRALKLPGLAGKLRQYRITKSWPECVGPVISRHAAPSRLIGKTLHVTVSSSPWMLELSYHKAEIMAKLNRTLSEEAVAEIIFRQGSVAANPVKARAPVKAVRRLTEAEKAFIEETASGIKDESLRAIVMRTMEKGKSLGS